MSKYGNLPESSLYVKIDGYSLRHWIDSLLLPKENISKANYIITHSPDSSTPYFESFHADTKSSTLALINTPYGQVLVKQCKST